MGEQNFGKPRNYVKRGTLIQIADGKKRFIEPKIKATPKHPGSATILQLLGYIAEASGTSFSSDEASIFFKKSVADESERGIGHGELSIRMHYNLPMLTMGSNDVDIPELNLEVKEYPKVRPGSFAQKVWDRCKKDLHYADAKGHLVVDRIDFLETNFRNQLTYNEVLGSELTAKTLSMFPDVVQQFVTDELKPSRVLASYPNLAIAWPTGFIVIPTADFDEALEFKSISKMTPQFFIRRSYLEGIAQQIFKTRKTHMKKVGIVAGSFKPFHKGHLTLVEIASRENESVRLIVSLSDRVRPGEVPIKGTTMERLWKEFYESVLPKNVVVEYTRSPSSPIRRVYEYLGKENEAGSDDTYTIYGTSSDINDSFPRASLEKYADRLYSRQQIVLEPISRGETVPVSGTEMRTWLHTGDEQSFVENTPGGIDAKLVWEALRADGTELVPVPVPKRKRKQQPSV